VSLLHCCHDAAPVGIKPAARLKRGSKTVMFVGAIISLIIAVLAALVSYGGIPNATAAVTAQHIGLIAIGLFVVSAVVTILDLELPDAIRDPFPRADRD
jgi:uncharacterized membrane protein YtjA (UPF0391 family)